MNTTKVGKLALILFVVVVTVALGGCPKGKPATPPPATTPPPSPACRAGSGVQPVGSCQTTCRTRGGCRNCCANIGRGDQGSACMDGCNSLPSASEDPDAPADSGQIAMIQELIPGAILTSISAHSLNGELEGFLGSLSQSSANDVISTISAFTPENWELVRYHSQVILPNFWEFIEYELAREGESSEVAETRYDLYLRLMYGFADSVMGRAQFSGEIGPG